MSNINKAAVLNPFTDLADDIYKYAPRASTTEYGIVALGSGIKIDDLGRIQFDTQEVLDRFTVIEDQIQIIDENVTTVVDQVNNTLDTKADKTYVDNQLTFKTNKADVYTKSETYTKQESTALVNNSISTSLIPVNTSLDLAKRGVVNRYDSSFTYNSGERVILANGDIVKSTVANNIINPNVDMTGWVYVNKSVKSVADLLLLKGSDGNTVELISYYTDGNKGGDRCYYDSTKSTVNDGVAVFNGWVRQLENNTLTPYMAGAKADYIDQTNKGTDDSSAFQKVIAYFKENPCVIECDPLAKHYIANPVIIPDYTDIRGNGAQLFGNAHTNDCFYTGYYVGNTLTSLVDTPENTKFLTNTKLRGFRYRYFKSSMKLRGMTQGCAVEDVRSYECNQHLWSREHYFCTFRQSYADHCGLGSGLPVDERTAVYDLWTLNGMINIETIQCSNAPLAYTFYSLQATELSHLDAEACETAIRLKGEIENPDIHGCYFENCGVVLDVSGSIVMGGTFRNNFINECTTGILGTASNCNIDEFDNRWRGAIGEKSRGSGSFRVYSKSDNLIKSFDATYPADNTPSGPVTNKNTGYATSNGLSEQLISVFDSASGNNLLVAKSFMGSTVPFVYFGKYPISNKINSIPFCAHTNGVLQPDNTFSIRITTSIAYSEFVRGDFALHVNTTDTDKKVFGKFFGLNGSIEYNGFTSFTPTVTVENVSGVIVIVLSGIKNVNNSTTYQCRGIVKLA